MCFGERTHWEISVIKDIGSLVTELAPLCALALIEEE